VDDPAELIKGYLGKAQERGDLTLLGAADDTWDVLLESTWKESVAASLRLGDWNLHAEAFFMRAPEDNVGATYRLLLQRNVRSGPWRFCANEAGDVMLVALVPRAAISEDELDRLLGALVTLTDETYVPYMKLGYQSGLEEQVRRGGPGVDQLPPWAREREKPPE
jgi:hypothetical protein